MLQSATAGLDLKTGRLIGIARRPAPRERMETVEAANVTGGRGSPALITNDQMLLRVPDSQPDFA